jgi:hypothetical protein
MVTHDDGPPHDDGLLRNGRREPAPQDGALRICPTRIDRAPVLFAHRVIANLCQDRQRGHYHKCFTCSWNNAWAQIHGSPAPVAEVERRPFTRAG